MNNDLYKRVNKQMISLGLVNDKYDVIELKEMITRHYEETGSSLAKKILDDFEYYLPRFKKVMPDDYRKMLSAIGKMEVRGLDHSQALIEAFYEVKKNNEAR